MTTNVVVATYHGVVLGCDSLSSITERAFFPFRQPNALARDANGDLMTDPQGRLLLVYSDQNLTPTPTNVMGGVQKMFLLHEGPDPSNIECSVAAVTSGLGTLNGVVIAELAARFRWRERGHAYTKAIDVLTDFLDFVRPQWEAAVYFDDVDEAFRPNLDDLKFLASGYGSDDEYIKVFHVSVSQQSVVEQFPEPPHCSATWAGQTNSIANLVNGRNFITEWKLNRALAEALRTQRESLVASVLEQLRAQGVQVPEPFNAVIDEEIPASLPWDDVHAPIDWQNLPVQSAVDLVSTLVNAESAIQKFSHGIATVGGRTRIGLMRRGTPFAFLNEPEIVHHHVGYHYDA